MRWRRRVLDADGAFFGFACEHCGVVVGTGAGSEKVARVVDDRDPAGGQALDAGRNQMLDGPDFADREFAADGEDDGGRRILLVARKQRALGQDQMDAGRFDAGERADGAGQFALEGAHIVDVLDEAGGAEGILLVEDFVADLAAGRQSTSGERHAEGGDLVARHEDGVAVAADLVGNVLALQFFDDGRRSPRS